MVLLSATGDADSWGLELQFPRQAALTAFQEYCADQSFRVTIERLYSPVRPDSGIWYGLSPQQRETLMTAVQAGYYSLPRQASTTEIAEQFDVSDQAVTERLRHGIDTLATNTLLATDADED